MSLRDIDVPPALAPLERDYEFIRELAGGGTAAVHLARERSSGRMVAIKAMRRRYLDDDEAVARFAREAATVAGLDHPNIVRTEAVVEVGDHTLAIIMQYVPGGTLRDYLREHGALSFDEARHILGEIAAALAHAHERGIVHRDVKPDNIFIDAATGRALLSDFGVARTIEDAAPLTMVGSAIGTPTYMSPEQIDAAPLDPRSDIYSLGLVGWEMLSGQRPWEGESLYGVIYNQKHEELPRLSELRPGIPTGLLFAIEGALHKHHDTRWASIEEFVEELTDETLDEPYVPQPRSADDAWRSGVRERAQAREARAARAGRGSRRRAILRGAIAVVLVAAIGLAATDRVLSRRAAAAARGADTLVTDTSSGAVATPPDSVAPGSAAADSAVPDSAAPRTATDSTAPDAAAAAAPDSAVAARDSVRDSASAVAIRSGVAATHADSLAFCDSPAAADQRGCLLARLADADEPLNRTYQTLVARLRRESGQREPGSVQQLRARQRAWIVERDVECRRRGGGREGRLWAPVRVECLAELSAERTAELQAQLDQLR